MHANGLINIESST